VAVSYATADGTGASPKNYVMTEGTLTFAPGDISKRFSVVIVDDLAVTGDVTVNLTLSAPVNATLGSPSSAVLTITEVDVPPTVQFDGPTYTATETDGTATIAVTLSGPAALPVTVSYATGDGTGTAGQNYVQSTGTVTFAP